MVEAAHSKGIIVEGEIDRIVGAGSEVHKEMYTVEQIRSGYTDPAKARKFIEETVKRAGAKVIDGLTGHGVGNELHEEPTIYNFGEPGEGEPLEKGMVLAIEPMICFTTGRIEQLSDDSYATMDGSISTHFEHTILIGDQGPEILSR